MSFYTDEITKYIVDTYLSAEDKEQCVLDLMEKYDKPKKSIIGKLSKEKVYIKQGYVSKTGHPPITKLELVNQLADLVNADPDKMLSFQKITKLELEYFISVVKSNLLDDNS